MVLVVTVGVPRTHTMPGERRASLRILLCFACLMPFLPARGEGGVVVRLGVHSADHREALVANHLDQTEHAAQDGHR